jgi:hypothetical protein
MACARGQNTILAFLDVSAWFASQLYKVHLAQIENLAQGSYHDRILHWRYLSVAINTPNLKWEYRGGTAQTTNGCIRILYQFLCHLEVGWDRYSTS